MNAFTLAHFSISVRALSLTTILTPRFYSFQPYLFTTYNGGFESIIFFIALSQVSPYFCDIIVLLAGSTLLICTSFWWTTAHIRCMRNKAIILDLLNNVPLTECSMYSYRIRSWASWYISFSTKFVQRNTNGT